MQLRLDPWAAEYQTAYQAPEVGVGRPVRTGIEVSEDAWHPIRPTSTVPVDEVVFLDGGRRIDARVLLEDDRAQVAFGALGIFGIGGVRCRRGARAVYLDEPIIDHVCALSSGNRLPGFEIDPQHANSLGRLSYRVISTPDREAEAVVQRIQQEMLTAEQTYASDQARIFSDALIVCDGPRPLLSTEPRVLGYVKTIHRVALPDSLMAVVRGLLAGQRSPLYLIETDNPDHAYFEWFLRLRDPRPWLYSLAGMVRLQAYAGARPEQQLAHAAAVADWSCLELVRFSSRQHQDPRAPQQLLPVRALEAELRRRMGDGALVRRRVTRFLSGIELRA